MKNPSDLSPLELFVHARHSQYGPIDGVNFTRPIRRCVT
jgi:hypothetical protein